MKNYNIDWFDKFLSLGLIAAVVELVVTLTICIIGYTPLTSASWYESVMNGLIVVFPVAVLVSIVCILGIVAND